ncbi:hypothetical protein POX_d05213 [Penicillium oxalicum]|uniref:Uncharacterized protein n=1 Tax=Penicillium oxalicum (strain 114-2 / CGMCC 5302) TaxID=933388 RepID=S7ZPI3_PENO1|nr:hypothetical protein POX_d05213 [Penicillium oxalicum]EPS32630.1 hypothetical protein PDE_07590 [Penicillium oxalicum 114-2]KAI2789716.1 hypothetical protein POX_d05213 [Penicillium oxalicum]
MERLGRSGSPVNVTKWTDLCCACKTPKVLDPERPLEPLRTFRNVTRKKNVPASEYGAPLGVRRMATPERVTPV